MHLESTLVNHVIRIQRGEKLATHLCRLSVLRLKHVKRPLWLVMYLDALDARTEHQRTNKLCHVRGIKI